MHTMYVHNADCHWWLKITAGHTSYGDPFDPLTWIGAPTLDQEKSILESGRSRERFAHGAAWLRRVGGRPGRGIVLCRNVDEGGYRGTAPSSFSEAARRGQQGTSSRPTVRASQFKMRCVSVQPSWSWPMLIAFCWPTAMADHCIRLD